jgi:hypothetical protein
MKELKPMLRMTLVIATACLTCTFVAGPADARAHYALKKLLDGKYFFNPVAITDQGISVGTLTQGDYAWGYSGAGKQITSYDFCGTSGGADFTYITGISPYSLSGFIVGDCDKPIPFLYNVSTNTVTHLVEPASPQGASGVQGVSAGGIVVGSYVDSQSITHGYYFVDGNYITFDPPGGSGTFPQGISPDNTVFGFYNANGVDTGFLLDETGKYTTLKAPGAVSTEVTGLNSHNQAVGNIVLAAGGYSAFFWQNNTFTIFPYSTTASSASAINENGIVAGSYTDPGGMGAGFVWNPATASMIAVNAPVSNESLVINGINNSNQITGTYGVSVKPFSFIGSCVGKSCF